MIGPVLEAENDRVDALRKEIAITEFRGVVKRSLIYGTPTG
jgi:hypothetical protein